MIDERLDNDPTSGHRTAVRLQKALRYQNVLFDLNHQSDPPDFETYSLTIFGIVLNVQCFDGCAKIGYRWYFGHHLPLYIPKSSKRFQDIHYIQKRADSFIREEKDQIRKEAELAAFAPHLKSMNFRGRRISAITGDVKGDLINFRLYGDFTLEELQAILEGIKNSHVMDEDHVRDVLET